MVAGCRDGGVSVFDRLGKSGGDVAVVGFVLVRVTVGDERGWFVEVSRGHWPVRGGMLRSRGWC